MLDDALEQQPVRLVLREELRQEAYSCASPLDGFWGEALYWTRKVRDHSFVASSDGFLHWSIVQSGIREVEVHVLDLHHRIVYD